MKQFVRFISKANLFLLTTIICIGCSDSDSIKGSCYGGNYDDKSKICIEFYSDKELDGFRMACKKLIKGQWSESVCDTSAALGGCKSNNDSTLWFYPSEKHESTADVEAFCAQNNNTFLQPSIN